MQHNNSCTTHIIRAAQFAEGRLVCLVAAEGKNTQALQLEEDAHLTISQHMMMSDDDVGADETSCGGSVLASVCTVRHAGTHRIR
jgi:predicted naringenin-chalcone synthase